jgi:hypothetical protein
MKKMRRMELYRTWVKILNCQMGKLEQKSGPSWKQRLNVKLRER